MNNKSNSGFWEKKNEGRGQPQIPNYDPSQVYHQEPIVLDEQAMAEIQGQEYSVFDEEEQDTLEIMSDANLRLEQGRLYQMVLQGDIFADTNADPKAIRNVQREIRKFVRERMEIMLGIRQEQAQEQVVSSPFNDMEVTVLKMLASKMSKGATLEVPHKEQEVPQAPPKRDGINSISGSLRSGGSVGVPKKDLAPIKNTPNRPQPKPVAKSAISAPPTLQLEEPNFQKPMSSMSDNELVEYEKLSNQLRLRATPPLPSAMTPHPSFQQQELMLANIVDSVATSGNRY